MYAAVESMVNLVTLIVSATVYPGCTSDEVSNLQTAQTSVTVTRNTHKIEI